MFIFFFTQKLRQTTLQSIRKGVHVYMIFLQVNQRERIACPLNSKQYSITYSLNHIHIYLKNNGQLYNNLLIHGSMYRILNVYLYV